IPQLRGSLKSRPAEDILKEANDLTARGVRELVVISQDTTDYGSDQGRAGLVPLVKKLVKTPAQWVRLLYAYPSEVGAGLMDLLADEPKLAGYLDMPLQHVSDRILSAMGRDWGEKKTRGLLDKLGRRVPGLALRTTFIVGFPGETDDDFERLVRTVREGHFEHVGVFPYSFESRSPSARLPGLVPPEVVSQRWQRVLDEHRRIKEKKDRARKGTRVDVLAERGPDGRWAARAAHQAPEVDGGVRFKKDPPAPGFYSCRVTGVDGIHLTGEWIH
ncbi:MAG: radical SAM protein, partial [Elusimicrobia bacterium]|nr:radical SAM protein [Elusimicrobiota bacterium]